MRYISTLCPLIAVMVSILAVDPASADQFFGGCDNICGADACDDFSSQGKNRCNCSIPVWTVKADYVHLWRDRMGSDILLMTEAFPSDEPVLFDSQFQFNTPGIDTSLNWSSGHGLAAEIRYLGFQDFTAAQTYPGGDFRFAGSSTNFGFGIPLQVVQESDLQSLELLGYRQHGCTSLSYGYRYVGLEESLRYFAPSASFPTGLFHETDNALYGFQIGLNSTLWDNGRRLRFDGRVKAGIYHNEVEVASAQNDSGSGRSSGEQTAFVGEFGLDAVYDIRRNLSFRAGYQSLYIDGVSLAADQSQNTSNLAINGPAIIDIDSSSILFQGLHVGLEYRR